MNKPKHTISDLYQMQSLSLDSKVRMSYWRIKGWIEEYGTDGVYVSFSGGKDSRVLLDMVRKSYPDIKGMFVDTGLEYPAIRKFVNQFENIDIVKPTITFREVIIKYGYPIISKEVASVIYEAKNLKRRKTTTIRMKRLNGELRDKNGEPSMFNIPHYKYLVYAPFKISDMCCDVMKKAPAHRYENATGRKPMLGQMANESGLRKQKWLKYGCNAFGMKNPQSNPMSFWTENDILQYIKENNLNIAEPYGEIIEEQNCDKCKYRTTGCQRTGCIFCLFGIKQDQYRLLKLKDEEPELADYVLRGGEFNEDGMWQPSSNGLGYWFILEWLNKYGSMEIIIPNREKYIEECGDNKTKEYLKI